VPAGDASIEITASGFEPAQLAHRAGGDAALRVVLSPEIPEGEVRIVLTWGERPRDLDAHLYGPLPGGGQFHVGFKDLNAAGVTLDVDAKEGLGPETITARVSPGTYHYYVAHNDSLGTSEGQGLARSEAQVRVYFKGASQRSYVIPSSASGPVWYALDIQVDQNGHIAVVPRNQFLRDLPGP
jgi:adhesin/invasin